MRRRISSTASMATQKAATTEILTSIDETTSDSNSNRNEEFEMIISSSSKYDFDKLTPWNGKENIDRGWDFRLCYAIITTILNCADNHKTGFLEVSCISSGKIRCFAAGTDCRFALYLINKQLAIGDPLASHIEAFKGEESVSFGPDATLVNYGKGWKLRTVTENEGHEEAKIMHQTLSILPNIEFLEVSCMSSGKIRRFAAGTDAGFALYLIKKQLAIGDPLALHIEAFKEGEESVSFGPNATLVNYGNGWKLRAVTEKGFEEAKIMHQRWRRLPNSENLSQSQYKSDPAHRPSSFISFLYAAKIFLVFVFIFLLGGALTLLLENLPALIMFVNSSL